MAFSDWNFVTNDNNGGGGGSFTQSATLNSSLSSPLTIGSSYCRRLQSNQSFNFGPVSCGFVLTSGFSSGAFYNIQNTKAIRVQSCVRFESGGANSNRIAYIGAKIPSSGIFTYFINDGYVLGIKPSGQVSLFVEGTEYPNLAAAALNAWHNLRLEVYPIGSASDRIKAYIETGGLGSNTWNLIADVSVTNPSSGYVNWGENRRTGFGVVVQDQGSVVGYFDNFSASVANAPTPIP
jgi:hypothetical protein